MVRFFARMHRACPLINCGIILLTTVYYICYRDCHSHTHVVHGDCCLGIALIEWPLRLGTSGLIPTERLDVFMTIQTNENSTTTNEEEEESVTPRLVTLQAHGRRWTQRLQRLVDEGYVDDLLLVS
jgi:hypothetical protein